MVAENRHIMHVQGDIYQKLLFFKTADLKIDFKWSLVPFLPNVSELSE